MVILLPSKIIQNTRTQSKRNVAGLYEIARFISQLILKHHETDKEKLNRILNND